MKVGSLFSGYGGLDMAVCAYFGAEVAWHVEYDKAPSAILAHHYPDVPNFGDVRAVDFTAVEPVDILTGGYPCQPFSHAGLRKGKDDERHLWPEVLRAIREMGPRLVVLENVRGHLSLGFADVLADLAGVGMSARWGIVRASDAGACHQRARLFIVACTADADSAGRREHRRAIADASQFLTAEHFGDSATDACGERHGRGQDGRLVGRVGTAATVSGGAVGSAREVARDRGAAAAADSEHDGSDGAAVGRGAREGEGVGRLLEPEGCDSPAIADSDITNGQAWRDAGCNRERVWHQPVGLANSVVDWGAYGHAIERWSAVIGRPAPSPTELGSSGRPRLSPAFVEWMMGLPAGWVTDPAIDISRTAQLKALGNGVVPQQAMLALSHLVAS